MRVRKHRAQPDHAKVHHHPPERPHHRLCGHCFRRAGYFCCKEPKANGE